MLNGLLGRRTLVVALLVLGAGAIAASGAVLGGNAGTLHARLIGDMSPVQIAATTTGATTSGTTTQQRGPATDPNTLLADVLARTGAPYVSATLGAPPSGSAIEKENPTDPPAPPVGQALSITVDGPDGEAAAMKQMWTENLIGGALSDELQSHGYGKLVTIQMYVKYPSGQVADQGAGIGNTVAGQQFSLESASALDARLRSGAQSLGLTSINIEIFAPTQLAPAVTAKTNDPLQFTHGTAAFTVLDTIFGDPSTLEGFYLELQDQATGAPFMKVASANRAGAGFRWVSSQYGSVGSPEGGRASSH
jgi:hypothetical protein